MTGARTVLDGNAGQGGPDRRRRSRGCSAVCQESSDAVTSPAPAVDHGHRDRQDQGDCSPAVGAGPVSKGAGPLLAAAEPSKTDDTLLLLNEAISLGRRDGMAGQHLDAMCSARDEIERLQAIVEHAGAVRMMLAGMVEHPPAELKTAIGLCHLLVSAFDQGVADAGCSDRGRDRETVVCNFDA